MKKVMIAMLLMSTTALADESAPQTYSPLKSSTSYYNSGGVAFGSDESDGVGSGNTTYIAPPVSSEKTEATYTQSGNTTYGSDGSVSIRSSGVTHYYVQSRASDGHRRR